jgi:hypothetical protein
MNLFDPYVSGSLSVNASSSFTGSVSVTGSIYVNLSPVIKSSQTASMTVATASYAITASYALNAGSSGGSGAGFPFSGSAVITGSLLVYGPYATFSSSQAYVTLNLNMSQSATGGAQIYGLNLTPTFWTTTGSQTQTAFRILATYTGSASGSNTINNIVDFGAVGAGSQFVVNDQTSGSIYNVNDISGLPIIEALSDRTVNIYNYPNIVFRKTGSAVIISGSLSMDPTGSFILPLKTSNMATIPSGSIFFSGSFLYVYNGVRYLSASLG